MTITLTPEIEDALAQYARNYGTTPERLAISVLKERFISSHKVETSAEEQGTLYDFFIDHLGVLDSRNYVAGGAQMSKNSGKKFAAGMAKKRRQGRL